MSIELAERPVYCVVYVRAYICVAVLAAQLGARETRDRRKGRGGREKKRNRACRGFMESEASRVFIFWLSPSVG